MKKSSIIAAVSFIAFMGIFVYLSWGMSSFTRAGAVGPGFAPRLFLYSGLVCAVVVILQSLFSKKQQDGAIYTNILVWKVVFVGIAYALLMNLLGYFISTFLALYVLMFVLGVKSKLRMIGVSAGFLIMIYIVFVKLLLIPVPKAPFLGGVI